MYLVYINLLFSYFTEILCPILNDSTTQSYVLSNPADKYTVDMKVTAECLVGYELSSGNLIRTCLENGEWSGQEPICTSRYYGTKFKENAPHFIMDNIMNGKPS